MKRSLIVLGWLCLGMANTRAQTPLRLTLDEAIARGYDASHRIAEIDARQDAARAIEDRRKTASTPQIAAAGWVQPDQPRPRVRAFPVGP